MAEHDALIGSYQHLESLPRAADALLMLRKIASLVKPIMRKRGWHVGVLTEFIPQEQNLLGVNYNKGQRICLRLRHVHDQTLFKDLEEVTDTMLHELVHIVQGPHNSVFNKLWDELRDEYIDLKMKGYSGEGFLTEGNRLGGRAIPIQEMRRQARAQAERRRTLTAGSGSKLGGAPVMRGANIRAIIADAASKRMKITQGCASDSKDTEKIANEAGRNGFRTRADEDEANNRAIEQALWELMQDEEDRNAGLEPELWIRRGPPQGNSDRDWYSDHSTAVPGPLSSSRSSRPSSATRPAPKPNSIAKVPSHPNLDWNVLRPRSTKSIELLSEAERRARNPAVRAQVDLTDLDDEDDRSAESLGKPENTDTWSCPACTLVNPSLFLVCEVCGSEKPSSSTFAPSATNLNSATKRPPRTIGAPLPKFQPLANKPIGWTCHRCGNFMESQWWTCAVCGCLKASS